jgi:2-keto-4-pentenoate hydratase/2-oxohepta-3-ene-1,7-dioic acid hydratase in catechol pathway
MGQERPSLLDKTGALPELSSLVAGIDAKAVSPSGLEALAGLDLAALPQVTEIVRFGLPLAGISKCLVIGSRAACVSEESARSHVAEYTTGNNVSERSYQLERSGTCCKSKGFDTFDTFGPLVTTDEVQDPHGLSMWPGVNEERMQSGSTRTMIFDADQIVSYVSHFMTHEPSDVNVKGRPPGVGMGKSPADSALSGNVVTLGIGGLGEQGQVCATAEGATLEG